MSKKVFHWLIADTIFAIAVTLIIIWLGNVISVRIDNETVRAVVLYAKTAIWIIIDLIVLFWFLVYWWSDKTWTRVKKKLSKL